jgi:hypothetical protein
MDFCLQSVVHCLWSSSPSIIAIFEALSEGIFGRLKDFITETPRALRRSKPRIGRITMFFCQEGRRSLPGILIPGLNDPLAGLCEAGPYRHFRDIGIHSLPLRGSISQPRVRSSRRPPP